MNAASVDIKDMLEAESGLDLVFGSTLFVGREPAAPSNCVTIFDTPSGRPQITFTRGENYFYPSIQIRVRNTSYVIGEALCQTIMEALHGRSGESWNGMKYTAIIVANTPFLLDWDENDRARFVLNVELQRKED